MAALVNFRTPPTVGKFMLDDHFCRLIMGPVGSGKSAGCFMELLRRAKLQEPDATGVRRTRFAIVRNTLQQLRQTCLADIQMWLSSIAHYRVTDSTVQVRLDLDDGTRVESDWMLIPLDTRADQQRLLSLNLTAAWVSEFREIPLSIIDALSGRLGRFPSKAIAEPTWYGIIAESNPPDEDSDWYTKMEIELPPNWVLYTQPGGLDKDAENIDNLPDGYYQNLKDNNNSDWVDIHVHAQYGKSLSGQAVFRASFNPGFHISNEPIEPIEGMPIMVGQDFGRTPASLIGQIDNRGRLVIFNECISQDMGIEQFCTSTLRPAIFKDFHGKEIFLVGDPSGRFKGQITEESPFDALQRLGFKIYAAPTNDIEPRLRAVEQLFLQQTDGGPMLIIYGAGCPKLVQALKFWYRYRRKTTGMLEDKPEKTHPWSDLADCLQYMALATNNNYIGNVISRSRVKKQTAPPMTAASWT